jgi:hypothetical protein
LQGKENCNNAFLKHISAKITSLDSKITFHPTITKKSKEMSRDRPV